jgi:hypothetical protein
LRNVIKSSRGNNRAAEKERGVPGNDGVPAVEETIEETIESIEDIDSVFGVLHINASGK